MSDDDLRELERKVRAAETEADEAWYKLLATKGKFQRQGEKVPEIISPNSEPKAIEGVCERCGQPWMTSFTGGTCAIPGCGGRVNPLKIVPKQGPQPKHQGTALELHEINQITRTCLRCGARELDIAIYRMKCTQSSPGCSSMMGTWTPAVSGAMGTRRKSPGLPDF